MKRKCPRCQELMKEGYGLNISSVFAGVASVRLADSDNAFMSNDVGKVKAAVCLNCGEISLYIDDVNKTSK